MSTATSVRPVRRHSGRPAANRSSRSAVSPAQFLEPPHARAHADEPAQLIADHSEAGMRRLRTPFEPDPA
jgi:hypothetical protein